MLLWVETSLCQYLQCYPSGSLAHEKTSKAMSNCFLQSSFQKQKTIMEVMPQRLTQMGGLFTQFLAFRQLSFQFNNTESYLLFLPFKSPRYLSCPLLMQSKKGFKTLSRQESRESFSSEGATPAGAQSQSKECSDETCVRS